MLPIDTISMDGANDIIGSHGLAAARLMSQTVNFSEISLNKTRKILGHAIDISKIEDLGEDEQEMVSTNRRTRSRHTSSQRRRRSSSLGDVSNEREMMLKQATTFRDLENLFVALGALEEWKTLANGGKK